MIINFNDRESASIKSFAVKNNEIKVTFRFMSGKLLMSAKLSLKSFIYDLAEHSAFPHNLYLKFTKIQNREIEMYHVLTDTESTALQSIIISNPNSDVPEPKFRDIIFEIIVATKIYK